MIHSFWDIWGAIHQHITGLSFVVGAETHPVLDSYFNMQPSKRNDHPLPRYPGLVLRIYPPRVSPFITYNDMARQVVEVTEGAPYLEMEVTGDPLIPMSSPLVSFQYGMTSPVDPTAQVTNYEAVYLTPAQAADFPNFTVAELLAALQGGFNFLQPSLQQRDIQGETRTFIRVANPEASSRAYVQTHETSAPELLAGFPSYTTYGRDAGNQVMELGRPVFYYLQFDVQVKTDSARHKPELDQLLVRLFTDAFNPNERFLTINGDPYRLRMLATIPEERPGEGISTTIGQFALPHIPVLPFSRDITRDNYNGGNYGEDGGADGTGEPSPPLVPQDVEYFLNVDAINSQESIDEYVDTFPWEDFLNG